MSITMILLLYVPRSDLNSTRCKCGCLLSHPPTSFWWLVYVCARVCARCVHLRSRHPLASVPLQRHWVVPFVAPAPTPFTYSFCLSVSYLIELAQKQSKGRYLRLRAKGYWCLGEVSGSISASPCLSLPGSFQENIWAADQSEPQWRFPILLGQRGRWYTPFSVCTDTLARF